MVSTLTSPGSDNKSKSGKKKYKKNALDFVDYETEFKKDPKFKTELCKTFSDTGHSSCQYCYLHTYIEERTFNDYIKYIKLL